MNFQGIVKINSVYECTEKESNKEANLVFSTVQNYLRDYYKDKVVEVPGDHWKTHPEVKELKTTNLNTHHRFFGRPDLNVVVVFGSY